MSSTIKAQKKPGQDGHPAGLGAPLAIGARMMPDTTNTTDDQTTSISLGGMRRVHRLCATEMVRCMETADVVRVAAGLREAMTFIGDIGNQPRISDNEAANDFFEAEFERVANLLGEAIGELRRRPSSGDQFAEEERLRVVAAYDLIDTGGSILKVVAYLAEGFQNMQRMEGRS